MLYARSAAQKATRGKGSMPFPRAGFILQGGVTPPGRSVCDQVRHNRDNGREQPQQCQARDLD